MIAIYSLLSFIQILFLPGLIYCCFKNKFNLFLIFSLSIFFNYILIILVSLFKIYSSHFLLVLLTFEIILFFYLLLKSKKNYYVNLKINISDLFSAVFIFIILIKLFQYFLPFFGSIFIEGDVLLSWNEWSYNLIGSTYTPGRIEIGTL